MITVISIVLLKDRVENSAINEQLDSIWPENKKEQNDRQIKIVLKHRN